jgi:drug/metabolite transporter (DMT)-like permease
MKFIAGLAFLFNTLCFATYYAVAKEALNRIDPIIFTYFELMTLAPLSMLILLCSRRYLTRAIVRRGVLLGSSLCLALFTIAIALKYTDATSVAFFPALNGFLAAIFAWLFLRQPIRKTTWLAGLLSAVGVVMLVVNSSMGGWRGALIAFLGGLFFTGYVFVNDSVQPQTDSHNSEASFEEYEQQEQRERHAHWPLFGVELLTMAVWANLVVLLFGDWHSVHIALPRDAGIIVYVALFCTFLPTLLAVLMQRHISPVTVSFIYILEPVLAAVVSALYLGEALHTAAYAGGMLVVLGAIIHTWGSAGRVRHADESLNEYEEMPVVWEAMRSHLQGGTVPYSIARKGEKRLLRQRRRARVLRLGLGEFQ